MSAWGVALTASDARPQLNTVTPHNDATPTATLNDVYRKRLKIHRNCTDCHRFAMCGRGPCGHAPLCLVPCACAL